MVDACYDLPADVCEGYTLMKQLPDGRVCGVHRLMYHWTMHVNIDDIGWNDKYCFATRELAEKALLEWTGEGDPTGWHRHLMTGRRRNIATGEEWIAY